MPSSMIAGAIRNGTRYGQEMLSGAGDPRFGDETAIPKRRFCVA